MRFAIERGRDNVRSRWMVSWSASAMILSLLLGVQRTWAQSSPSDLPDPESQRCLESTCRSVPLRETLVILGSKNIRGVFGGFEQGAGFGGGVQFTSGEAISNLKLRANVWVSSWLDHRADREAVV